MANRLCDRNNQLDAAGLRADTSFIAPQWRSGEQHEHRIRNAPPARSSAPSTVRATKPRGAGHRPARPAIRADGDDEDATEAEQAMRDCEETLGGRNARSMAGRSTRH